MFIFLLDILHTYVTFFQYTVITTNKEAGDEQTRELHRPGSTNNSFRISSGDYYRSAIVYSSYIPLLVFVKKRKDLCRTAGVFFLYVVNALISFCVPITIRVSPS